MSTVDKIFRTQTKSIAVKLMEDAIRNNYFLGIIIFGRQQLGKTRYAFKIMYQIYRNWQKVLEHTVFDISHLINILSGKKKKVVLWDDAGVHGNKYLFYSRDTRKQLMLLQNLMDLVGTRTNVLILTTPSISNLARPLREYPDWIRIQIRKLQGNMRVAKVYIAKETISGRMQYVLLGEDKYALDGIPKWVLDTYYPVRDHWAQVALKQLQKALEEREGETLSIEV